MASILDGPIRGPLRTSATRSLEMGLGPDAAPWRSRLRLTLNEMNGVHPNTPALLSFIVENPGTSVDRVIAHAPETPSPGVIENLALGRTFIIGGGTPLGLLLAQPDIADACRAALDRAAPATAFANLPCARRIADAMFVTMAGLAVVRPYGIGLSEGDTLSDLLCGIASAVAAFGEEDVNVSGQVSILGNTDHDDHGTICISQFGETDGTILYDLMDGMAISFDPDAWAPEQRSTGRRDSLDLTIALHDTGYSMHRVAQGLTGFRAWWARQPESRRGTLRPLLPYGFSPD